MTVRELVAALMRRWYVVVFALVIAVAGIYFLQRGQGVYSTETVVSFLLPNQTALSPSNGLDDANLIAFAGLVARKVNNGETPAIYSIYNAPLYGAGVRQGVVVSIPNAGNQFATSYQRAEVVLQIVGPSERWVALAQTELLSQVVQITNAQQASVMWEKARIHASPEPATKKISRVTPSRSAEVSASIALVIAALLIGGWGAVIVDRMKRGRKITANEGPER
jgi:hypothetical protein